MRRRLLVLDRKPLLSLLGCAAATFLVTGSVAGPTEVVAEHGDLVSADSQPLDENGKRIEVEPGPLPEARPLRFDLDCDYEGRVVADPNPRPRGTYPANEPRWEGREHFIVDLYTMTYCNFYPCELGHPRPIAAASEDVVYFYNDPFATSFKPSTVWTVDLRDGRFFQRIADDEGYIRETTGTCRMEEFSGFPPGWDPH